MLNVEEVQLGVYILAFVSAFFHFVPIALSQENFGGQCLLFTSGQWIFNSSRGDPPTLTIDHWGAPSLCNLNIFMGMCTMIVSFAQIVRSSCSMSTTRQPGFLTSFIDFAVCLINVILYFITSMILSIGFQEFCALIVRPPSQLHSCNVDSLTFTMHMKGINVNGFYSHMNVAQFGVWFSWLIWIANMILAYLKLNLAHNHVGPGQPFATALSRETEKLIETVQAVTNLP